MTRKESELLNVDEKAALLGKSIEETNEILEKFKLPIVIRRGECNLYDPTVVTEFVINHPDIMSHG